MGRRLATCCIADTSNNLTMDTTQIDSPTPVYASRWYKRYRIVRDNYLGYEVQYWRLWYPFWVQAGGSNTHDSLEEARLYALNHAGCGDVWHV